MVLPFHIDPENCHEEDDAIFAGLQVERNMTIKILENSEVGITCPHCKDIGRGSVKLIVKTNHHNGHQFLGCPNFPDCSYVQQIPEEILMRAAGQKDLFSEENHES